MRSRWLGVTILGLALGVGLFVISCKKSTSPGGGTPADVTIGITGINGANSYFPNPDTVTVGQTVAWHNAAGATHTATSLAAGVFDTGHLSPGATSGAIRMNAAGSFPYECSIHTTLMTGTLVVRP
jgi:plastocyanin